MQAAVRLGGRVSKIAIYEAPHNDDPDAQESWSEYLRELGQLLADGRGGDAVALFMRFVGTPDDQVEVMRQAPFWPGMEAIAPTLAYDHAVIIGERWSAPADLAARVSVPALVIAGEASLPFMPHTARALSQGDAAGQAADAGGTDSQREPGRPRSDPGGLLHLVTSTGPAALELRIRHQGEPAPSSTTAGALARRRFQRLQPGLIMRQPDVLNISRPARGEGTICAPSGTADRSGDDPHSPPTWRDSAYRRVVPTGDTVVRT